MALIAKKIKEADLKNLAVGNRVKILLENGDLILTSPVENFHISPHRVIIKTKNSLYTN